MSVWRGLLSWRALAIFLIGGVLGTAFSVGLGYFTFPYVFPPPAAMDVLSADEQAELVATGRFIQADPSDPIHYGSGTVKVYAGVVYLDSDFEVGPGPAFHVYLVPTPQVRREADVERTMFIDLGGLRAFKGSQKYVIPAGVDLKAYKSVVIWCERFGVLISPADLEFVPKGAG